METREEKRRREKRRWRREGETCDGDDVTTRDGTRDLTRMCARGTGQRGVAPENSIGIDEVFEPNRRDRITTVPERTRRKPVHSAIVFNSARRN